MAPKHHFPRVLRSMLCGLLFLGLGWLLLGTNSLIFAQSNCTALYQSGNGWSIAMCPTDPSIGTPMEVVLDGAVRGQAALVRIYHQAQHNTGAPQVMVIYASGFIRLKPNADPTPALPFGSSFVLGPAYWPDQTNYYHNPQLARLEIDTRWLPTGPLHMQAKGTNHQFAVFYQLTLPPPRDPQTRLHVTQTFTATANIKIDPVRRSETQGLKLVQVSSMFINQDGVCDGGHQGCHDSNAVRFIGNDLARHQVAFSTLTPSSFIISATRPLSSTWLDVLHTDDEGWQGNTPNVRITLDALPHDRTITPQGWLQGSTNPNEDNVGIWLHDDGPASQSWAVGQSAQIGYWLLAQDNPPEPWSDLGLRPGKTFLNFEGSQNCYFVHDVHQLTSGSVQPLAGYSDTAFQLNYNVGSNPGNWAQVRCDFNPPLDLSAYDHLHFDWRGDPNSANSLEVGMISLTNGQEHIFGRGYHHATQHGWWGQLVIPFAFLNPWTAGTTFDPSQVSAIFVSVVKDPVDDVGGTGSITIDNLSAYNVISRTLPITFENVITNPVAAKAAANWLATQQQDTGLLKSWEGETTCLSHTYDQALALLVFTHEQMWTKADTLVDGLTHVQNTDGSWFQTHTCALQDSPSPKWEGDIAWTVYALSRYMDAGGTNPQAPKTRDAGIAWLKTRVNPADGCLVIDHTEATIDAWWAFQAARQTPEAEGLKHCLLTYYWDEVMGRFKGGKQWWQPYLDNQTWGAAFLNAIGEQKKALRALSYAKATLLLPAQGGQLFGFDGQAGPWSVWNEGAGQYVSVCGQGANALLLEGLAQQREDGAVAGSSDEFLGGGVWTTRWDGIAPTAWLYFAKTGGPFDLPKPFHAICSWQVYLPIYCH